MMYHHLHADEAGESHWRDIDVDLREQTFAPPAKHILMSDPEGAKALVFLVLQVGWDEPIHRTPRPQTLICLAGAAQVTASDGEVRDLGIGDIRRMDDLTERGHHTRITGDVDFEAAVVQFG